MDVLQRVWEGPAAPGSRFGVDSAGWIDQMAAIVAIGGRDQCFIFGESRWGRGPRGQVFLEIRRGRLFDQMAAIVGSWPASISDPRRPVGAVASSGVPVRIV